MNKNIFVVQKYPSWWVKIGDFGVAKRVSNQDSFLQTATGTPVYQAPEVSHYVDVGNEESNEYTNVVDIWSLACVVYQILALQLPFPAPNFPRNLILFCKGGQFPELPLSQRASQEAVQFVKSTLIPLPNDRPSALDTLRLPWLQVKLIGKSEQLLDTADTKEKAEHEYLINRISTGEHNSTGNCVHTSQWENPCDAQLTSLPHSPLIQKTSVPQASIGDGDAIRVLKSDNEEACGMTNQNFPNRPDSLTTEPIRGPTAWSDRIWDDRSRHYYVSRYDSKGAVEFRYRPQNSGKSQSSEPRNVDTTTVWVEILIVQ